MIPIITTSKKTPNNNHINEEIKKNLDLENELNITDLSENTHNNESKTWNEIEKEFNDGMIPNINTNNINDAWSKYDVSPQETVKTIFLSNTKISKNITDSDLKISVWSLLISAGGNNKHIEKMEDGELNIKIIKLGKFPILRICTMNAQIAEKLVKNINYISKNARNDIDNSWRAKIWLNKENKDKENIHKQQQRLNKENVNLLDTNYGVQYDYNYNGYYGQNNHFNNNNPHYFDDIQIINEL